jgi:folate-binding protein YgfZ
VHQLDLHQFHQTRGAHFDEVRGREIVRAYGDVGEEYAALTQSAGLLDLSFRGRLCLIGLDRQRFLHGQVTNGVKDLKPGEGCYAALVTAKGKLVSDLNVICLGEELLLDMEPGCSPMVKERLEKYVIADDVQIMDVAANYGLLSVQGPKARETMECAGLSPVAGREPGHSNQYIDPAFGELCCVNQGRGTAEGFDVFVPNPTLESLAVRLLAALEAVGGKLAGWDALELVRVEAGLPRFGQDMDESNLAPEAGIEARAISYSKGCYIGQEVIARIRTYGQVAKALRGLAFEKHLPSLPAKGERLFHDGKDAGYITSVSRSPRLQRDIALGYVRKECNEPGTQLAVEWLGARWLAEIVPLPFVGQAAILPEKK